MGKRTGEWVHRTVFWLGAEKKKGALGTLVDREGHSGGWDVWCWSDIYMKLLLTIW